MFEGNYKKLNSAQREAVDTIDGPVLVVAGPGTGKTQLLSMRVANILKRTDVGPHNILCVTFTEDAARNMRERLSTIIGQAAYDVEIHTFHSFGASIIAKYGEYFYQGIGSQPIDELASHEIFEKIFRKLPHDNPLSMQYNGEFLYLKGARVAIDNFKTAGLAPSEVRTIAVDNIDFAARANPEIAAIMNNFIRVGKKTPELFSRLRDALANIAAPDKKSESPLPSFIKPLSSLVIDALTASLEIASQSGKTTSLTEFKNAFLNKDATGQWQLKDSDANKKLVALADIYEQYLLLLREENLLDFNDMITRVVHALENFAELRYNLQEQYQYILVDEFQDTSLAQLRLVGALTDNPVFEGRPNILAVGDDDQAIYSFQGAELSNILSFHHLYRDVKVITLTDNYRSRQEILDAAQQVIAPSPERLVRQLDNITKNIVAKNTAIQEPQLAHHRFGSADQQRQWIASQVAELIAHGHPASDIAIIAAKHSSLMNLVPFLHAAHIGVQYDKRENILKVPAIEELITVARLIVALSKNDQDIANGLLPIVLSYQFWGLSTKQVWQLYLENYRKRSPWVETAMQSGDPKITQIAEFFVTLAMRAPTTSLEIMLDLLIGNQSVTMTPAEGDQLALMPDIFICPYKKYYFADHLTHKEVLDGTQEPQEYLELLSHLRYMREKLREFRTHDQLTLADLIQYVDLCERAGVQLVDSTPHRERHDAVHLYTAHASKGLEFGAVFIIDANQEVWGSAGSPMGKISMPRNLAIERASGGEEERRRLLYVAITRAKHFLAITGFRAEKRGNAPLKHLIGIKALEPIHHEATTQTPKELTTQLTTSWQDRHIAARTQPAMRELLLPTLERYRLSVTHMQRFLNVTDGGPAQWFLQCLLHFPQATTPNMAFGNAVHATLEAAQKSFKQTGERRSIDDLLEDFDKALARCRLDGEVAMHMQTFGHKVLRQYLTERYPAFRQEEYFEFDLGPRQLVIGGARVTGKIDRITPIGDNNVRVTDFKTGKPMYSWDTNDPRRQVRLYHYKQQLAFYRLLLEEGNAFGPSTKAPETAIEFVQPDSQGAIVPPLTYRPTDEDITRLRHLIPTIWHCMTTLELPDVSAYDASLKGILQFENDLLANTNY